ncbi:hypothetical protein [Halalkalibacterium halodurans]|uniref:hypothetical protein n=1 Tax=Halalkalibacterium halodurans TaxID=86665 RepID=UPI002AAA4ECB|nr:hypothetical protein [Halalkalibacterium halodurans]MDY7222067.1 hypothetical protein [Halalkalibacterium halodurans]MDY7243914.1 hypothetical protein [Halalkalibacterium halodurans]
MESIIAFFKANLEEISVVVDIFIALFTLGAVLTSLYLSRIGIKPRSRVIIRDPKGLNYLEFRITNKGLVPINVKKYALIVYKPFWRKRELQILEKKYVNKKIDHSEYVDFSLLHTQIYTRLLSFFDIDAEKGTKLILTFVDSNDRYYYKKFYFKYVPKMLDEEELKKAESKVL